VPDLDTEEDLRKHIQLLQAKLYKRQQK
jgi:hypothetical protein